MFFTRGIGTSSGHISLSLMKDSNIIRDCGPPSNAALSLLRRQVPYTLGKGYPFPDLPFAGKAPFLR